MENNTKNTILVPLDFSEIAMNALTHAVQVAKHFSNNIALLHVVETGFFSFNNDEKAASEAEQKLIALADDIKATHGISTTTTIKSGRIYKVIAEAADELRCDSIIMGSNGAAGLEQIIGSNASRVIMHATVPVVVVKSEKTANAYKNIVFPLDLTIESRQKVTWAIHLGKSYNSVIRILTFHVEDEEQNIRLTGALRMVEELLEEQGVKYTQHVLNRLDNSFAEETIKYAEAIDSDLIMIMTHQEDLGLGEYIMGTEAQQVVNKSQKIPVMCIKPRPTGFSKQFAI